MTDMTLHVSGLMPSTTDEAVEAALEAALAAALGEDAAPPVMSCAIPKDKHGTCRGFCFVAFANAEDAATALRVLHGHEAEAVGVLQAQISQPKKPSAGAGASDQRLQDITMRKKKAPSRTKHPQSITCSDKRQSLDPKTGKVAHGHGTAAKLKR